MNSLIWSSPQPSEVNTIHVFFHIVEVWDSGKLRNLPKLPSCKIGMRSLDSQTSERVFVLTPQTLGTAFTSQTALGHRRSLPAFPTIGLLVPLGEVFFLSFFLLLMVPVTWKGFLLTWTQSSQGFVQNPQIPGKGEQGEGERQIPLMESCSYTCKRNLQGGRGPGSSQWENEPQGCPGPSRSSQSPLALLGILIGQQLVTTFPSITPTFSMKQQSHKFLSSSLTLVLIADHYI